MKIKNKKRQIIITKFKTAILFLLFFFFDFAYADDSGLKQENRGVECVKNAAIEIAESFISLACAAEVAGTGNVFTGFA